MSLSIFRKLASYLADFRFEVYLVGGAIRKQLLFETITDYDLATPNDVSELQGKVSKLNLSFKKYGSATFEYEGIKFQITTFRKESDYQDFRHPKEIIFTKSMEEDSFRRDFTINALYMDQDERIYDFHHGMKDLKKRLLRFIGDPETRCKEDPLRIIRLLRFSIDESLSIETNSFDAALKNAFLISYLRQEKIKEEFKKFRKMPPSDHVLWIEITKYSSL
ncbi:MAG: hypothetical protein LBR37_03250 [Erysipelotrichaceae bacterium]|jgi:tRNA nucleotidyltransferase (CCA-adding enzyme)|nr:hypothetical protein [Erysipelotrichaceae bacterium]